MQAFVRIAEMGIQSEKGRIGHSISGGKKSVAPVDRPLALAGQFINALMDFTHYTSREAAELDLRKFKEFVAELDFVAEAGK